MGTEDIRDPEYAERLESAAPDEYLRRREFLQRAALTAGLAGSLATVLDSDTLVANAAKRQDRRSPLPNPRNAPIDTIVVLMMENRSFDHYLGWMPEADGRQAGLSYVDKTGQRLSTRRMDNDFQGCGHPDPDHGWEGGRTQLNGGRCDGFLRSGDNDIFSISYYAKGDLGFIQDAALAFTTYDRFHCSLMGPTLPNREYMHAAQSYGLIENDLPPQTQYQTGFPDNTIFAACEKAGVSNRYYFNDVPVSALWGQPGLARSGSIADYYAACASRDAPASLVRRSELRRQRRRGAGPVGRRAPARRRADRPGLHGRRRPRLHGVPAVQARRDLRRLRRVGRVLRPRAPGPRAR